VVAGGRVGAVAHVAAQIWAAFLWSARYFLLFQVVIRLRTAGWGWMPAEWTAVAEYRKRRLFWNSSMRNADAGGTGGIKGSLGTLETLGTVGTLKLLINIDTTLCQSMKTTKSPKIPVYTNCSAGRLFAWLLLATETLKLLINIDTTLCQSKSQET
jgi:hypothetical protein